MEGWRLWRRVMLACLLAGLCTRVAAAPLDATLLDDRASITLALQNSAAGWNAGNLDGFMKAYEDSPDTVYVAKTGLVQGFTAIRAMYAARFGGAGGMGRLSLSVLSFRALGPDHALVAGRFSLLRPGHDAAGIFTLVFHKSASGWGIVSDHTS